MGDENITKMYHNLRQGQGQNVFVMTNSIKRDELVSYFNSDYYNLIDENDLI